MFIKNIIIDFIVDVFKLIKILCDIVIDFIVAKF